MLAALAAIKDTQGGFKLRCIHVEHGIRPAVESRGDAEFVRSFCKKIHVPCHVTAIKPGKVAALAKRRGIGIEAAARLYRRRAWRRHLQRLEGEGHTQVRILVAHTADDMRETALLRILRGSGPSGLAAMPASRGRILRPLITLSRHDVLNYLSEKNIAWREDSTNTDTQFLRNRIRKLLIPRLNEHFPQWGGAIAALAKTQSLTADFIRKEAVHRVKWGVGIEHSKHGVLLSRADYKQQPHSLLTDTETFFAQPAIIREEALFRGINRLGIPAKIRRTNVRRFAQGKLTAVDFGPLQLRKDAQHIMILAVEKDEDSGFCLLIKAPGSYNLKGIAVEVADVHPADYHPVDCHQNVFFSLLPLVFRPCFGEFPRAVTTAPPAITGLAAIVAEDFLGTAAFIGTDGLLQCRENQAATLKEAAQAAGNEKRCAVRVKVTVLKEAAHNTAQTRV
jgi:tRNA(Ile)-lysidine synthase